MNECMTRIAKLCIVYVICMCLIKFTFVCITFSILMMKRQFWISMGMGRFGSIQMVQSF